MRCQNCKKEYYYIKRDNLRLKPEESKKFCSERCRKTANFKRLTYNPIAKYLLIFNNPFDSIFIFRSVKDKSSTVHP